MRGDVSLSFDLYSPMISGVEHLLMYLLAIYVSSLEKMSIQILCPVLIGFLFLLLSSVFT